MTGDGEVRHLREVERNLEFKNGKAVRGDGTIQDISAIKQSEEQLHQAQKMQAVGQLTGGVAHDFNNLLGVIMGNAELLLEQLDDDNEMLDSILRAASRGAELTHRLLAFSRQQTLMPRTIEVNALISDSAKLFSRTFSAGIKLEVQTVPDLWHAWADHAQLENALLNLAINARDAMPEGGELTISCENAQLDKNFSTENSNVNPGDYVLLSVSDTGSGMSAEVQAHVFEPFFTTKEVGRGSGLGLSMVYGFTRQSGGHTSISSVEGQGTTVKLYLPRTEMEPARGEALRGNEIARGHNQVVLVVEDDPDVRGLAVSMLHNFGYQAIEAADADSARMALAHGTTVDLVLADVVLPGGTSGLEFVAEARKAYPDLKVIFMSGYSAESLKQDILTDPGIVLLNKPFRKQQLAKALHDALA